MMTDSNNPPAPDESAPASKPIKISLASLSGAKEGDIFKVAKLDEASGMAYLTPEKSMDAPVDPEPSDAVDSEAPSEDEGGTRLDTSKLLGPMDGLKNYLVQKSMDAPKNQGR